MGWALLLLTSLKGFLVYSFPGGRVAVRILGTRLFYFMVDSKLASDKLWDLEHKNANTDQGKKKKYSTNVIGPAMAGDDKG